ncbi:hypothetical protein [Microcella sp.]|uniref:hypothetical protein n=1 Tax=Microcella sp. TaxID=1913979 RepID=UPI003918D622
MTVDETRRLPPAARVGRAIALTLALILVAVQLVLIGGLAWATQNPRVVADHWTVSRYTPPTEIAALADRAGLSERGRFLFYASRPEVVPAAQFDEVCTFREPGIGVLGCYTLSEGRIFLFPISSPDLEGLQVVVAAHEMLHAAWDRMTSAEQDALAGPLEEAFAALGPDHELVERIALYEELDPGSRIPELYAILGTEVAELSSVLSDHYAGWFDDRGRVTALYAEANAVFRDLDQRLEALNADLTELSAVIDDDRADFLRESDELAADIADFNERANTPGAFDSEEQFAAERAEIIARQEALEASRDALNDAVDRYNALVADLEALNAEAAELNRAINISVTPQDTEPDR